MNRIALALVFGLLAATAASAQTANQPNTVVKHDADEKGAAAPSQQETGYQPKTKDCDMVQIKVPVLKAPARFWIVVFDPKGEKTTFLDQMRGCNDGIEDMKDRDSQFVSVDMLVVSNQSGWATFLVPKADKNDMFVTFYSPMLPDADQRWKSAPFGDTARVELAHGEKAAVVEKFLDVPKADKK